MHSSHAVVPKYVALCDLLFKNSLVPDFTLGKFLRSLIPKLCLSQEQLTEVEFLGKYTPNEEQTFENLDRQKIHMFFSAVENSSGKKCTIRKLNKQEMSPREITLIHEELSLKHPNIITWRIFDVGNFIFLVRYNFLRYIFCLGINLNFSDSFRFRNSRFTWSVTWRTSS